MKARIVQPPSRQSSFLLGARGTGKSTLLNHDYSDDAVFYIDLLNLDTERRYSKDPQSLFQEILALPSTIKTIVIDEIQKIPALLDVVHALIEKTQLKFILTGSSARKLRKGHANMLAGRAVVKNLYPFSFIELGADFQLDAILNHGSLPALFALSSLTEKQDYLRTYSHVYLKEEVWAEHLIRQLEPFQYFLEVAAHGNGDIINTAKIARDVGVDHKTVQQYYTILEDTLLGFHLNCYRKSFRKRLVQKPKFYFFDIGVTRALANLLAIPVTPATYDYGKVFEHFIILECYKLVQYAYPDYRLSYLKTTDGWEVDLVVERPGQPLLFVEIKSATQVTADMLTHLQKIPTAMHEAAECVCFANVERPLKIDDIMVYPWRQGILHYFPIAENSRVAPISA